MKFDSSLSAVSLCLPSETITVRQAASQPAKLTAADHHTTHHQRTVTGSTAYSRLALDRRPRGYSSKIRTRKQQVCLSRGTHASHGFCKSVLYGRLSDLDCCTRNFKTWGGFVTDSKQFANEQRMMHTTGHYCNARSFLLDHMYVCMYVWHGHTTKKTKKARPTHAIHRRSKTCYVIHSNSPVQQHQHSLPKVHQVNQSINPHGTIYIYIIEERTKPGILLC